MEESKRDGKEFVGLEVRTQAMGDL